VAHVCNPSYSGGRDQEDCGSKPVWANSSTGPYLEKKPFTKKRVCGVAQGVGREFKPQYHKKKKKKRKKERKKERTRLQRGTWGVQKYSQLSLEPSL
jgi:hypothetical protein